MFVLCPIKHWRLHFGNFILFKKSCDTALRHFTYLLDSIMHYCSKCLTRDHIIRSLAATSASYKVHPRSTLLMSFWTTSHHHVFGRPGLLFQWDGFQWYSLRALWRNRPPLRIISLLRRKSEHIAMETNST